MIPIIIAAMQAMQENKAKNEQANAQNGTNNVASGMSLNLASSLLGAKKGAKDKEDGSGGASSGSEGSASADWSTSDRRLKDILGDNAPVDEFAKINAYLFKYRPEARKLYGNTKGVDDKEHVGVIAQELAENPVTTAAVEMDENGYLTIDDGKLTMALAAVCADLSKRVLELERHNAELAKEEGKENG